MMPGEAYKADPGAKVKERSTVMLYAMGDGTLGPPFIIIKATSKDKSDMSNTRVLDLLRDQGYTAANGWSQVKMYEITFKYDNILR